MSFESIDDQLGFFDTDDFAETVKYRAEGAVEDADIVVLWDEIDMVSAGFSPPGIVTTAYRVTTPVVDLTPQEGEIIRRAGNDYLISGAPQRDRTGAFWLIPLEPKPDEV